MCSKGLGSAHKRKKQMLCLRFILIKLTQICIFSVFCVNYSEFIILTQDVHYIIKYWKRSSYLLSFL